MRSFDNAHALTAFDLVQISPQYCKRSNVAAAVVDANAAFLIFSLIVS